jgi:TDG/mug DNA glycosylase family protein
MAKRVANGGFPDLLQDVLRPGLDIIFCGTAAGRKSASIGAPYADASNRFWMTLYSIGLTPTRLSPADYQKLLKFGLGLTDIAKRKCGVDTSLSSTDFDVPSLMEKLDEFKPRILAFNGKKAASVFYERSTRGLAYGRQPSMAGGTIVWVLPSTSGSARRYWDLTHWSQLAELRLEDL